MRCARFIFLSSPCLLSAQDAATLHWPCAQGPQPGSPQSRLQFCVESDAFVSRCEAPDTFLVPCMNCITFHTFCREARRCDHDGHISLHWLRFSITVDLLLCLDDVLFLTSFRS